MKLPTLVDVYTWVKETEKLGYVPMEGIYRHALSLSKTYTPAIIDTYNEDSIPYREALKDVEKFIGKPIVYMRAISPSYEEGFVWVSIAVDSFCPHILNFPNAIKVTVLHDTMATKGVFGESNKNQFLLGARHNDYFAYVSEYAKRCFIEYYTSTISTSIDDSVFGKYGNYHRWSELPSRSLLSLHYYSSSVGSVYERKNLRLVLEHAKKSRLTHFHVGSFKGECEEDIVSYSLLQSFHYLGALSDTMTEEVVSKCGVFYCLSKDEGFSMTPLEAIVLGVEKIILSDIPAHREVYDEREVNFVDIESEIPKAEDLSVTVSEDYRKYMFDEYNRTNVENRFENFLKHATRNHSRNSQ